MHLLFLPIALDATAFLVFSLGKDSWLLFSFLPYCLAPEAPLCAAYGIRGLSPCTGRELRRGEVVWLLVVARTLSVVTGTDQGVLREAHPPPALEGVPAESVHTLQGGGHAVHTARLSIFCRKPEIPEDRKGVPTRATHLIDTSLVGSRDLTKFAE